MSTLCSLRGGGPAGWFELWVDGLAAVLEAHLTLECESAEEAHAD